MDYCQAINHRYQRCSKIRVIANVNATFVDTDISSIHSHQKQGPMKTILRTLLASSLLTICVAAHADTLNGTTVSGTITGPTTPGFTTPTSSVGSTVEFTSAASNNFLYTADFNDTGVLFTVSCNSTVRGCAAIGVTDFTATFTDSAFLGGTFDS